MELVFYSIICGIIAILFILILYRKVSKQSPGSREMVEISLAIRQGAKAFLKREYKTIAVFAVVAAFALLFVDASGLTSLAFVAGAILSVLSGNIGMRTATMANARTAEAAKTSLSNALHVAFSAGSIIGLSVAALGLIGLGILFWFFSGIFAEIEPAYAVVPLFGFSFGASSIALFARVGGGIYTKAADIGADMVGKVEAGIPEDDPRNPAVIADNVGDNVGDVAGMGADLFESYVGSIVAAMALGFTAIALGNEIVFPLLLAGVGIIASILGIVLVNLLKARNPEASLLHGTIVASVIMAVAAFFLTQSIGIELGVWFAVLAGLAAGAIIGYLTEYYTSNQRKPARDLAESAKTGASTFVISGIALGNQSTALPIIVLAASIGIAYYFAGLFGIAIAGVGMLSTVGITLAVEAYGPVADNAGGIAQMARLNPIARKRTDELDAAGNTTAAIGKGFAIGSAALTAVAFFAAYSVASGVEAISITDPLVIIGLLVGAMLPFLFSSLALKAVGSAAGEIVEEVRRQWKHIKGLAEGKAKPDYAKCVDISTAAALKKMKLPAALAILAPIVVGFFLGPGALGGLLAGALATGVLLALYMANSGAAWDNAKKFIEAGNFGGTGSEAHKAAVIGDTIGDPFKDTAGPSLNILIKLMSIIALIIAPIIAVGT